MIKCPVCNYHLELSTFICYQPFHHYFEFVTDKQYYMSIIVNQCSYSLSAKAYYLPYITKIQKTKSHSIMYLEEKFYPNPKDALKLLQKIIKLQAFL